MALKGKGHDLSKVTLSRHLSGSRLGLQLGGILLREVDGHIHSPIPRSLFSVTQVARPRKTQRSSEIDGTHGEHEDDSERLTAVW